MGEAPGDDRLAAAARLAERSGAIALLKVPPPWSPHRMVGCA